MFRLATRALVASDHPYPTVVEIGTRMGEWLRQFFFHYPIPRAFGIDPWLPRAKRGLQDVYPRWVENLKPWIWKNAFPLRGTSQEWAHVFHEPIDVLYIDGDHRYGPVLEDFKLWVPKVRQGGVVLIHDVNEADVRRAVDEYFGPEHGMEPEAWGPGKVQSLWMWR